MTTISRSDHEWIPKIELTREEAMEIYHAMLHQWMTKEAMMVMRKIGKWLDNELDQRSSGTT